jgi:hypothetical protein
MWEDTNLGLRVCKWSVSGMSRFIRGRTGRLVIGIWEMWKMCMENLCRRCMWVLSWDYMECVCFSSMM